MSEGFEVGIQNAWSSHVSSLGGGQETPQGIHETGERLHSLSSKATTHQDRRFDEHTNLSLNKGQPYFVGYSEIDKYATSVYERHFKGVKTADEIKADLDNIKTIFADTNYAIIELCYVNTVESVQTSIKTTNQSVKTALESTNSSGVLKILKKVGQQGENIMLCENKKCLICTAEVVNVVESGRQNFSHSNTETEMDTSTEKSMELAICINSPSKFSTQKNTKSYATTVITLKEDTVYAHIKKTKRPTNFGDITKIKAEELPDFDCLVGGVPCQAWSIAGKRGGFSDDRGNMWWHFIRILKAKEPTYFVAENVKGILSHDKGRSFEILCEAFCEAGYVIDFELLNSKNFGTPQNRERVILVGVRQDAIRPEFVI